MNGERRSTVVRLLAEYVRSPSLPHIRELRNLHKLAEEIVLAINQADSIWTKWEGDRLTIAKAAWPCWIPQDDLREYLNRLPGPELTATDVAQRLRAFWEENYYGLPKEELKEACVALYHREKEQGTELVAIIGAIAEFVEVEEERLRIEREAAYRRAREDEKVRLQQRFLAGADTGWIQMDHSKALYRRMNGRAYRIEPTKEKRWNLHRITQMEDTGKLLGAYQSRGDANKALKTLAFEAEPRW